MPTARGHAGDEEGDEGKEGTEGKGAEWQLPPELTRAIIAYVPSEWLVTTNRWYYTRFHYLYSISLIQQFNKHVLYGYIHKMIQADMHYVFSHWAEESFYNWIVHKKRIYKGCIYSTTFDMLHEQCIENDADRCRNAMREIAYKNGYIIKKTKRSYSH